ncbi:MAG: pyridoxamine 5'-phosphate oxidase family protein [Actinobacteria bacterium]|nr:pyridoxamine 5'-phosphate oxidase family protein [Actinomycetota bacterium]
MSVKAKPGTSRQAVGSKMGEMLTPSLFHVGCPILETMAKWSVFESEAPALAAKIRSRFEGHPHHILGTLDSAGAPRLSGLNVFFNEGVVWFGSMPSALKSLDIKRDPRVSLHSATLSEELDGGDARISGLARELPAESARAWRPENPSDGEFFQIDVQKAHIVEVADEQLVITMWDAENGLRIVQRQ